MTQKTDGWTAGKTKRCKKCKTPLLDYEDIDRGKCRKCSGLVTQTFAARWRNDKGEWVDFNLYPWDSIDDLETKKSILEHFNNEHFKPLKAYLSRFGLSLKRFEYFSPREYNFIGDNMDIVLSIASQKKLLAWIEENREAIQKSLDGNKSHSGYIALTAPDVDTVIDDIQRKDDIDIIVINEMMKGYPIDYEEDIFSYFVDEELEEMEE